MQDVLPTKHFLSHTVVEEGPGGRSLRLRFVERAWEISAHMLYTLCRTDRFALTKEQHLARDHQIRSAEVDDTTLVVHWVHDSELVSRFPLSLLATLAPMIAQTDGNEADALLGPDQYAHWDGASLVIPEVPYREVFHEDPERSADACERVNDLLFLPSGPGVVKLVDVPEQDLDSQLSQQNATIYNINAKLFGAAFDHPRRGRGTCANLTTRGTTSGAKRNENFPALGNMELLTHADVPHYINTMWAEGLLCLEGRGILNFTDAIYVARQLEIRDPDAFCALSTVTWQIGRAFQYYQPTMHTASRHDTVIQLHRDGKGIKTVKMNAHLRGFPMTNDAKLQADWHRGFDRLLEMCSSEEFAHFIEFEPKECFLINNHRVHHGRKKVLEVPRTVQNLGAEENAVWNHLRHLKVRNLQIDDQWVAQIPTELLDRHKRIERGDPAGLLL